MTADVTAAKAPNRSVLARTAVGMGWIVGWRMATRLLGLLNTLILVRLLAPADFGLVALGTSFAIAVDTLSTLGIEDALVREAAPTQAMYDTAFTMTLLRSLATALVIAAAAIPVAGFFAEPRLAHILWALAIGAVIEGTGSVGIVDFRRDMVFEKEFLLQILPRITSIVVAASAALIWHSYWALVAGILSGRVLRTLFGYRMHAWRPRITLSAWRALIGFSLWSWAISMAELVRDRMDTFVIGRVLDPTAVGVYAIGEEVAALPTSELVQPLCRACFSGFAEARRADQGMRETFMRPVATTFLITLPAGLGISLVADPLVRLVVGAKWAQSIPVIELLGIMGAVAVFGLIAATMLSAHAMLKRQFTVTLISVGLRLLLLVPLVSRFGILGAALGAFAGMALEHAMFIVSAFRRFGLSLADLVAHTWRTAAAAAAMALVLVAAGLGWTQIDGDAAVLARTLAEAVTLGATVYVLTLLALWRLTGRPSGAEADLLGVFTRLLRGLGGYFARHGGT
jgi:O-antigen/teichoic acid export membrane protein